MNTKKRYIYVTFALLLLLGWIFSSSTKNNKDFSESVKISLRDVGNQLLLLNQDSTSVVLPVIALDKNNYSLSFQNKLFFEPNNLVTLVKNSFNKLKLPNNYRVSVFQCVDDEVAYSYQMGFEKEDTIVPCKGRVLPENCYTIQVKFKAEKRLFISKKILLFGGFLLMLIVVFDVLFFKKKEVSTVKKEVNKHANIGIFKFYPEENKLVKQATEISLSKKECELLAIFVASPNQIIKRDELTKKVWEDNGVFVGRSLDTYISKLRKKLKEDSTIKLTNIHGVGYKLELN